MQAIGGALAVTAALELLPATVGSERRAAVVWASAGATGAALGPAVGGILTELVSWQSIFLLQVPMALAAAVPILAVAQPRGGDRDHRAGAAPRPAARTCSANLALAMVSAAIAAALFLLVLLLIEGWRLSPIGAAIVVSVMPLAALLGSPPRRPGRVGAGARAAAGAILLAGGLAGLALLPKAEVALTVPPQILSASASRWCSRR